MKLGLITPTRGKERAAFVEQAARLIHSQTYKPAAWYVIDYTPKGDYVDIAERVQAGLELALTDGITHLAFWEDDDYYREDYLSNMLPHLDDSVIMLGSSFMPLYHLRMRRWGLEYHGGNHGVSLHRTIASTRYLKAAMDVNTLSPEQAQRMWWLDNYLWATARASKLHCKIVNTGLLDCITIKHGVGKCGTRCHVGEGFERVYVYPDPDMHWLRQFTGNAFPFYEAQSNKLIALNTVHQEVPCLLP